jgi:uracil-DNA glycosylase family 4
MMAIRSQTDPKQPKSDAMGDIMGILQKIRGRNEEEIRKAMTEEEWTLELRDIDVQVARMVSEAGNIAKILSDLGAPVPSVPVLSFINKGEESEVTREEVETVKADLPGRGSDKPVVVFVGASPSKLDAIRRRPFSGMIGKTLDDLYLESLGLDGTQVYFTNIVKDFCEQNGKASEPTAEQVEAAWEDFVAELTVLEPRHIVALGKTAHKYLKDVADEWVPHPRAVNIRGNSGEVERKMKRLAKKMAKPTETISGFIIKGEDEKQIVYGIVMEPMENDTDANWTTPEEIEEAAHYFMKNFRLIDTQHTRQDIDAMPVESWVTHEDTEIGGQSVKAGSWVMGVKVESLEDWAKIKRGEYAGFSIDAFARIDPSLLLVSR